MADLSFRQLEVFAQVVECGSFRGAAEQLDISQVSVSAHVSTLEELLGTQLFQRKRGATAGVTAAGEAVYRRAKELLQGRADLLSTYAAPSSAGARSKLRIAAHGYIAERFSRRLAAFVSSHPDIEIELERRPFEGVVRGMQVSDIEVGFFLSRGPVPEIDSVRAWQENIALYVSARHPLAKRGVVSPSELSQFPFYFLPERSHLRHQMDAVLGELEIRNCPTAMVSDDHVLIVESLGDGRGFACLFADGMEGLVERGDLERLQLSLPLPTFDVRYAVRGPFRRDRTTHQLVECLTQHHG